MWEESHSDDLARAIAPIWEDVCERLEVELDERDRLAVVAGLTKAALSGYRQGFDTVRESAVLDAAIQGVDLRLDPLLVISNSPDVWEAYMADDGRSANGDDWGDADVPLTVWTPKNPIRKVNLMAHETRRFKLKSPESSEPVANGPTVITEGMEGVDNINRGDQDFLQAGVVASTDWSFTANINSATGALGSTGNTGGTAWLPDPVVSGALMRSVTTPATLSGIAPSLLPASGKYVSVGFELTPTTWGAGATVTAHSGIEKATQAEAEAAPPATTAGKLKVRDVVVTNTAGVYSIVAQFDERVYIDPRADYGHERGNPELPFLGRGSS